MAGKKHATLAASRPKRKRALINYAEHTLDENDVVDVEEVISDEEDAKKVAKVSSSCTCNKSYPLDLTDAEQRPKLPYKKKLRAFHFLDLPAELRNAIYELALQSSRPIGHFIVNKSSWYKRTVRSATPGTESKVGGHGSAINNYAWQKRSSLAPGLLATNRKVYAEAKGILYDSPFRFENSTALFQFLSSIGYTNRLLLKDITLDAWGYEGAPEAMNYAAFAMLAEGCHNLDRLFIHDRIHSHSSNGMARAFYKTARSWLEAVGRSKGAKDAAVDVVIFDDRNWGYVHGNTKDTTAKSLRSLLINR